MASPRQCSSFRYESNTKSTYIHVYTVQYYMSKDFPQYALDPSSLYNTVTNNSTFFLKLASFMGLETCANSLEPLKAFLRPEIESSAADCDGFIVDKYLAAAEEADTSGNVDALLAGLRGRKNILGSLLDLFIGGEFLFTLCSQCSTLFTF